MNGFDYNFVSRPEFDAAVAAGTMLEHMVGPEGASYGLPRPPGDRDCGATLVAIVDVATADRLAGHLDGQRVAIKRLDGPLAELRRRMLARGDDPAAVLGRTTYVLDEQEALG